jgi:hypothetical protein
LINGLAVASFYSHISGLSTRVGVSPVAQEQPLHLLPARHYGANLRLHRLHTSSIHA